jgi:hypothetical protein
LRRHRPARPPPAQLTPCRVYRSSTQDKGFPMVPLLRRSEQDGARSVNLHDARRAARGPRCAASHTRARSARRVYCKVRVLQLHCAALRCAPCALGYAAYCAVRMCACALGNAIAVPCIPFRRRRGAHVSTHMRGCWVMRRCATQASIARASAGVQGWCMLNDLPAERSEAARCCRRQARAQRGLMLEDAQTSTGHQCEP